MNDKEVKHTTGNEVVVEFLGSRVFIKRSNGGPTLDFTHQEWHDIKAGKYDPKKNQPVPE